MNDTIYRQAAIDAAKRVLGNREITRTMQTALHILPSAQPDIITCVICRYADGQIADGRYWCRYHEDYMRYCSDAERREG